MFGIGPMELVVIVVVALLIFGPQKLPEFARTIGKGLAEFRRASNDLRQSLALDELQNDLRKTMNDATRGPASRPAQAGDTLPPGSGASPPTPGPAAESVAGPASTDSATTRATPEPPWKGHPGELPEGIDHEHRDPDPRGQAPREPDHPDPAAPPAIDSELGNVPVTGVDPADARRG